MSARALRWVRVCGGVALASGVLNAGLITMKQEAPGYFYSQMGLASNGVLAFVLYIGFVVGLIGALAVQAQQINWVGRIGFGMAIFALFDTLVPLITLLALLSALVVRSDLNTAGLWASVVNDALLFVGLLLAAVGSFQARRLPGWGVAALVLLGLCLLPEMFFLFPANHLFQSVDYRSLNLFMYQTMFAFVIPTIMSLLWAVVGLALLMVKPNAVVAPASQAT